MRSDDHILDRASGGMLGRARACKVMPHTVRMVTGIEPAGTATTTRGRFP